MSKKQPEALRLAEMLTADEWPGNVTLVSYARECVAELRRLHAYCQELESQVILDCMTHVQNHAEIEHVADDMSKNETGSNTAGAWIERWHGSGGKDGYEGWSIVNKDDRALVAYLGRGVDSEAVTKIVMAHNATRAASHGQASSQAGEYPALVCDYCGALTPDPWHSSGMLRGKMSKHIHSCDACAARGAAEAQAASSAVLKAIREANMQLVRTGDDAFMLVPYKAVTAQAAKQQEQLI